MIATVKYLTTSQLVALLANRGTEKSYPTIDKWMRQGVKRWCGGPRIVLRSASVGGCRVTTEAWYDEFNAEITKDKDRYQEQRRRNADRMVSPAAARRDSERSRRRLEAAGAR